MTKYMVEFDWQRIGRVKIDEAGQLKFPKLPARPGLYQFWFEGGDERPASYIGEAANLYQRMQHYRTSGTPKDPAKPTTNQRMNRELKEAVRGGQRVSVWTIARAVAQIDAEDPIDLPMDRRNGRLIAEQAAVHAMRVQNIGNGDDVVEPVVLDRPGLGETEYE